MTKMLASVMNLDEALLALEAQVDIIDLKQPERGALGALDISLVQKIVAAIGQRCLISATIGDLPMQADTIADAVAAMAATGVDYVKIGFFVGGEPKAVIDRLSPLARQGMKLIAVLFGDQQPNFSLLPLLQAAGFAGVMLDTADKGNGPLIQLMALTKISQFVTLAKTSGLLCGLAGSLRRQDVAGLLNFQPDYLGFRGALCESSVRTGRLDRGATAQLRQAIATSYA